MLDEAKMVASDLLLIAVAHRFPRLRHWDFAVDVNIVRCQTGYGLFRRGQRASDRCLARVRGTALLAEPIVHPFVLFAANAS